MRYQIQNVSKNDTFAKMNKRTNERMSKRNGKRHSQKEYMKRVRAKVIMAFCK